MFPSTTAGHYWADKTTLRDLLPLTDKGAAATIGWRTQQYGNVIWTMKNASSTDGVTFNRDDVAVAARAIRHNADGSLDFLFAAAAANPIVWVVQETLGPTGLLTIKAGAGLNFATGATVRIGTTDAFDLILQRNGVDVLSLFGSGDTARFGASIRVPPGGALDTLTGDLQVGTRDAADLQLFTSNAVRWSISSLGAFFPGGDNLLDLGGVSNRLRDVFVGTNLRMGSGGVARMEAQNRFRHQNSEATVTRTAAQSIPDATATAIAWDAEDFDTDAIHDNVTNNTRLTVPMAGKYLITANVSFAFNATGTRLLRLRKNGASQLAANSLPSHASIGVGVGFAYIASLAASDFVEIQAFQNSGGALNVLGNDTEQGNTFASIVYVGE